VAEVWREAPVLRRGSVKVITHGEGRDWTIGAVAGVMALVALVAGSGFGEIDARALDPRLVAWTGIGAFAVFGVIAVARTSAALSRLAAGRSLPAVGGAVRVLSAGVGYLLLATAVLDLLDAQTEHLLVGVGLAGVVLGIAAQQSLGNVFAGIVLILARPFGIGDHVRIRSGALGGIFEAQVREISLVYVTLQTEDGELKVPNSAMLAAGIGHPVPMSSEQDVPVPAAGSDDPASPSTEPDVATAYSPPLEGL
jgi:small-conductance mechanosensitive channel